MKRSKHSRNASRAESYDDSPEQDDDTRRRRRLEYDHAGPPTTDDDDTGDIYGDDHDSDDHNVDDDAGSEELQAQISARNRTARGRQVTTVRARRSMLILFAHLICSRSWSNSNRNVGRLLDESSPRRYVYTVTEFMQLILNYLLLYSNQSLLRPSEERPTNPWAPSRVKIHMGMVTQFGSSARKSNYPIRVRQPASTSKSNRLSFRE